MVRFLLPVLFLIGIASYYHPEFQGRKTSSGEAYNRDKLTAACNRFPLGTYLKVTNLSNNCEVIVKVNDRLGNSRLIDLSLGAARKLKMVRKGLARVKIERIKLN